MVSIPKEKTFPRGGREERSEGPRRRNVPDWCQTKSLKGLNKKTYAQNRNRQEKWVPVGNNRKNQNVHVRQFSDKLKYSDIAEGMLILGSISRIEKYQIIISLPGNCSGIVPITNISEPYSQSLASLVTDNVDCGVLRLQDMFQIGQHVVTKVVKKEILDGGTRYKLVLSLAPAVVQSDCLIEDIVEHSVFTAAVVSVETKIYVMDLGIKSVRAFLKKEDTVKFKKVWNHGKELGIGQILRCSVTNVSTTDHVTTVVLTLDPWLVAKASTNRSGTTLQALLPGMLFSVTVSRQMYPSGIQVRLSDNVVGYVNKDHLSNLFKSSEDFEVGDVHWARVLYISQSGVIFFTMKNNICPPLPPGSPFNAIKAGYVTNNAVVLYAESGLTVRFGKRNDALQKGFISLSHIKYTQQPDEQKSNPTLADQFPIGSTLTCRVIDYNYLDQYYVCTMNESLMNEKYIHPSSLKVGLRVSCTIKGISPKGITMTVGKRSPIIGFVPIRHVSDVPLHHPEKKFNIGQTCDTKVLRLDDCIHLTMKESLIQSTNILTKYKAAEVGKKYTGTVVHMTNSGILVEFFSNITGWVPNTFLGLEFIKPADIKNAFYMGQVVNCTVIDKCDESQKLSLSLMDKCDPNTKVRPTPRKNDEKAQETIIDANKKKTKKKTKESNVNAAVICEELKTEDESMDISANINQQNQGRLKRKQSPDSMQFEVPKKSKKSNETCQERGQTGSKIKVAKIESPTKSSKNSRFTFQVLVPSETLGKSKRKKKKKKLSTGSVAEAAETEIKPGKSPKKPSNSKKVPEVKWGVCSDVEGGCVSSSTGTKFKVELETPGNETQADGKTMKKRKSKTGNSSFEIQDVAIKYEVNSKFKGGGTGEEENSYFEIKTTDSSKKIKKMNSPCKIKVLHADVKSITNGTGKKKNKKSKNNEETNNLINKGQENSKEIKNEVQALDSDSSEEDESVFSSKPVELPPLSVATGFVWDATPASLPAVAGASGNEDSSDDEPVLSKKAKRSRQAIIAEKRLQAQIEEARLRSIEQRLMDPEQLPQTADEFDRLVLSSPDNSMVWLQYMAHHIQATEIEKARAVAQQALKTISFREEQEKLNVWVAWLNLENLYGTNESLENTLEEAIRLNDPYQVYTQMLQIYADSHKLQDGDNLIAIMTRKFKTNKDMWINVATFYMKSGQTVKARALLQRALASLDKKEHVLVISQFALLENKSGSQERAQTLMEQILTSYPKRVDVWSVYVDMLTKSNLFDMARQVLERAVAQRLPSHKMKTLFKKFLAFEEAHGTEDGANKVRQLALDYVEAAAGSNME